MSSTRELYHPLKDGEIRVLRIEPGTFDDPIHCALSPCLLDDNPTYQALSYTWGDPSIRAPIKVDGHVFMATTNLESALRYLRDTEITRVLWVDAVCINQEDIPERGMQVQQMRRIYKNAKDVLIWLGPPELPTRELSDEEHLHVETESAVSSTSNHFTALKLLADWFRSDESGDAKFPHLYSENEDKWRDALRCNDNFNYLGIFGGDEDSSSNDSPSWVTDWEIIAKHSFRVKPLTIYDNDGYCYKAATDLTPDLRFHNNDRAMSVRGVLVSDIDTCGQVMDADTHSHFDILSQWEDIMVRRFRCDDLATSASADSGTIMNVWDSWKTRICSANVSWHENWGPISEKTLGGWSKGTLDTDDWQTSILNLRQARGSMKHQESYAAGGTLTEAYCRTLLMNKILSESDTLERFHDDHVPVWDEDMCRPTPTEFHRISMLRESRMFDKYLKEATKNRRLFITSKGYIGLGHQRAEKGDRLCILYGSPVPYILRPHGDYWNLVGQCYAHGLMNGEIGEALERGEVTSQVFEIR
ncbi:hypothetical protein BGAL_0527g00020 [Botrytis galanthina]|uniref:Heterokaryon incompatibility domain-containing protein n=1 Tax=Botrytis galanthina TaxID=278940 RepID=A0A4S8QPL1_9HELO|nr:hypothetical protein BGAL_0527g00020 [Botrytis galanthina]